MRILHLSLEASLGGTERSLFDLVCGLKKSFPAEKIGVLCLSDGPLAEELRRLGIGCEVLPMPKALSQLGQSLFSDALKPWRWGSVMSRVANAGYHIIPFLNALRSSLLRFDPDLIHSHGIKTHLLLPLCAPAKAKVVWHCHEYLNRPVLAPALRWAGRRAGIAIANSEHTAANVAAIIEPRHIECIYYGIDLQNFLPGKDDGSSLDRLAGMPVLSPAPVRVGLVATYAHWKGHFVFLEAIGNLKKKFGSTGARFYIVGGPIYRTRESQVSRQALEARAKELGIGDIVAFVPFQSRIADVFRALDVVVHASTRPEPFGRTIIEAMACGKPVIAAAEGGAQEIFVDGTSGLAVPPRKPELLADAMKRLIDSPELRMRTSDNARKRAVEYFARETFARNVMEVYKSLFATKEGVGKQKGRLVVAVGYLEDEWHSNRHLARSFVDAMSADEPQPYLHAPSCEHKPTWLDRRIHYSKGLPPGDIFCLMDQSYGDSLIEAKRRYRATAALVFDIAFWRDRNSLNYPMRRRIVRGLALADRLIAGSHASAMEIERTLGLTVHAVIPPGVSPDVFAHSEAPREPGLLLHVGSVGERKGFDRALRLLSALPSDFHLLHVGEALTPEQLDLARDLGVDGRLGDKPYPGLKGLVDLYHRSAVVLVPSRYEGFGLPAIEARLCGTSVALSGNVPAYEQMQNDPGTMKFPFEVFDAGGIDDWKEAAQQFQAIRREASRYPNRDFFRWDRVARDYRRVFSDLQEGREAFPVLKQAGVGLGK